MYARLLGATNDLCKMEYHLACAKIKDNDIIDAIVVIPDSEGSFVELGMLVMEDKLHDKILVLFNKDYESTMDSSFIGLGAKAAFDNGKARTKLIDYNKSKLAFDEVSLFLYNIRSNKTWHTWKRQK